MLQGRAGAVVNGVVLLLLQYGFNERMFNIIEELCNTFKLGVEERLCTRGKKRSEVTTRCLNA